MSVSQCLHTAGCACLTSRSGRCWPRLNYCNETLHSTGDADSDLRQMNLLNIRTVGLMYGCDVSVDFFSYNTSLEAVPLTVPYYYWQRLVYS